MIDKILAKLGLTSIDQLNAAEKATYQGWAAILGKSDVTIEDLKKLLPIEIDKARAELLKFENSKEKDLYQKAYVSVLENLTKIILTPAQERDNLRSMLIQKYGLE